jgi:ribonuclease P protein component
MSAAVPTLKASSDFQRISRTGKRWNASAFIIIAAKQEGADGFRLGLTASRKVGNAVIRNRAKRRLREMVRISGITVTGFDIVLIAKTAAASQDFAKMTAEFLKGLQGLGVTA